MNTTRSMAYAALAISMFALGRTMPDVWGQFLELSAVAFSWMGLIILPALDALAVRHMESRPVTIHDFQNPDTDPRIIQDVDERENWA